MKYILVTGGVISGIGKGIISSSIGTILKAYGWNVTCIKIDPYLNIDAGTFSPYEHGEVYVLDDGSEVDLDLGNYERFLDIKLTKDNNITTGKIYLQVTDRERRGDYLGKTVQVVPHITDSIIDWVTSVAKIPVDKNNMEPEVCIIELGGTIGDIESMPFVEAFRQLLFRVGRGNFCCVHVSLVPQLATVGEPKTKPTQASVRELRACGLQPDLLMCRCSGLLPKSVINKISMFSQVPCERVFLAVDVKHLYEIPIRLDNQNLCNTLLEHFNLSPKPTIEYPILGKWKALISRSEKSSNVVRVVVVGKYTKLGDAYISVLKALSHAAIFANVKLDLQMVCSEDLEMEKRGLNPDKFHKAWLCVSSAQAVVVPGGFGLRGIEGKLLAIQFCREHRIPFLGLCLGLQCAVIEFARNVLGWKDASSVEFHPDTTHPVIIDMPEHNKGVMGGTMRLGTRFTSLALSPKAETYIDNIYNSDGAEASVPIKSIVHAMIGSSEIQARHRHRYEVNPAFVGELEDAGLLIVGRDIEIGNRMEIIELFKPCPLGAVDTSNRKHPYFVATQFHPEYTSRPTRPSVFYLGLLLAATKRLDMCEFPLNIDDNQLIASNDKPESQCDSLSVLSEITICDDTESFCESLNDACTD